MTFGQQLLNLLYEHDLTQKQLSIDLKIAPTTLNGYINNRREPDYKILKQIANYFHVTTDYLLGNQPTDDTKNLPVLSNHEVQVLYHYQNLNDSQKEIIDELLKLMQKQNTMNSES